jgi:hypothetical protein
LNLVHSISVLVLYCVAACASAQAVAPVDSDADGLSDTLEDALLQRFAPQFMLSSNDCSVRPARFEPGLAVPMVAADDGTIYGQATPHAVAAGGTREVEVHFYHLWRRDCGRMGHALDAEHVAVLLRALPGASTANAKDWHAVYWYAAAHEDTVCDASQMTRASTLHAEDRGARVWISSGKHASFLNEELCHHGCGGDRCENMQELASPGVVNLGELRAPMGGAAWASSARWPLVDKLGRSDFVAVRTERLERLPATDIAWANPAKRPAQAAILGGNSTVDGAITGVTAGGGAVAVGGRSTDSALTVAGDKTGTALGTAARGTGHALGKSLRAVKKALGGKDVATPDAGPR